MATALQPLPCPSAGRPPGGGPPRKTTFSGDFEGGRGRDMLLFWEGTLPVHIAKAQAAEDSDSLKMWARIFERQRRMVQQELSHEMEIDWRSDAPLGIQDSLADFSRFLQEEPKSRPFRYLKLIRSLDNEIWRIFGRLSDPIPPESAS